MDLIEKEERGDPITRPECVGLFEASTEIGDSIGGRVQGEKTGADRLGEQTPEGGLAGPRWAKEYVGGDPSGADPGANGTVDTEDRLLAEKRIDRVGPKLRCEWFVFHSVIFDD